MSDNVIGYGSDSDDWYTLGQIKRAVTFLRGKDLTKDVNQEALKKEQKLFNSFLKNFIRKGRGD